jgi:hypothetical protein
MIPDTKRYADSAVSVRHHLPAVRIDDRLFWDHNIYACCFQSYPQPLAVKSNIYPRVHREVIPESKRRGARPIGTGRSCSLSSSRPAMKSKMMFHRDYSQDNVVCGEN